MANTKDRLLDATGSAKPYVERALTDDEVRENVKNAFAAAREVYNELVAGRGATALATRVATDKDLQEKLKEALDELREASDRVQGKKDHSTRNTTLLLAGIALGILFNPMTGPETRKWIRGKVFGAEEDFGSYGGGTSGGGTSGASGNSSGGAAAGASTGGGSQSSSG